MKKLRLRYLGDPVLRRKARQLDKITPQTLETIEAMWDLMYDSEGIGLAAPQVGLSQRIIVADTRERGEKYALVNPKIVWENKERTVLSEGCLSIPGVKGDVLRPSKVRVEGLTPEGKKIQIEGTDLLAKVFQHEIDHLNGVLFIDLLSSDELERLKPDLAQFEVHAKA
jgi:peptide deformylase